MYHGVHAVRGSSGGGLAANLRRVSIITSTLQLDCTNNSQSFYEATCLEVMNSLDLLGDNFVKRSRCLTCRLLVEKLKHCDRFTKLSPSKLKLFCHELESKNNVFYTHFCLCIILDITYAFDVMRCFELTLVSISRID